MVMRSSPDGFSFESDQPRLGRGQLGEDVMRRAVEHFALFGENEATGVAVEKGHVELRPRAR